MFLVLWSSVGKKTALLVFSALGLASAKTKCAVCAWAFQYAAQRPVHMACGEVKMRLIFGFALAFVNIQKFRF